MILKLRKTVSFGIALLWLVSMLASCKNGESDDDKSGNSDLGPTIITEDGREKAGIMYTEGLPIVDPGDYTFTLFVDDAQEDDDYVMFPILEEQTGIKVELWKYPNAIAIEKLSLQLNSGDYADCIGGWTLTANDILVHGMDEKVYVPLDEYFAEYCPRITEILDLEGVRETMTTPDGHIYSVPYVLEAPEVNFNPYVNTRWLENVGLEMPKTTEEFRTMLRAFRDQDANGNGNAKDEIPFAVGPDNKHLGELCGWFGMSVDDEGFTMVGDQLTFGANTEEYKNGIKFLASLYAEGLIDPELFTQDTAQWKAKGGQDLYGCVVMYASSDIMPYDAGTKPDWEPLPVLSSPECSTPVWLRDSYGTDVLKNQVVITDNAEYPQVICRWWDNFLQLDNVLQSQNGPLNITLFKNDDGSYTKIDMSTLSEADQKLYDWGNLWPQALPKYVPAGFKVTEEMETYQEKPVVDNLYQPYLTEAIPNYWIGVDKASRLADLTTSIKDYITTKKAEWISGQADVDSDWEAYCKQLEKLGLQELIDLRLSVLNS